MLKRVKSWFSIKKAEKPDIIVLLGILFLNVILISITAFIISSFNLKGTEGMGFFEACFYTVTMIFDAGCVQYVIADIGSTSVFISILCLVVIVIGMVTFTGALIGYVTNKISAFIEEADSGKSKLYLSKHIVIIGWNNKGFDIISDLVYNNFQSVVVVLVNKNKKIIHNEIKDHLEDYAENNNISLKELKRRIKVIVKEGDLYSSNQLKDVCTDQASSIIILENENEDKELINQNESSTNRLANSQIIKSAMQVADICSSKDSLDNQNVIVECSENWTYEILKKIADYKTVEGRCRIVALPVKRILGNLMSQLTIMPDLNNVYGELFSNEGVRFCTKEVQYDKDFIDKYITSHQSAIPLNTRKHKGKYYNYYSATNESNIELTENVKYDQVDCKLNDNFAINNKNIVVLGHNHNFHDIFRGFMSFYNEWNNNNKDCLSVTVIDDRKSVEIREKYLKNYPFIKKIIAADINERALICDSLSDCLDINPNTNILILSDDTTKKDDIDTYALTNLIYVQDVIKNKKVKGFDDSLIDIVVEIVNPKHYDVVSSYSIKNVVISSKFISKMIMQIGTHEELYKFYKDILTYDKVGSKDESKEIYIKTTNYFFDKIPQRCNAKDLIRTIYDITKNKDPQILLGYIRNDQPHIFGGRQEDIIIDLKPEDKLIIYSCK